MKHIRETLICSISFVIGLILIANGLASLHRTSEPSSNNVSNTSAVPVATLILIQSTPSVPTETFTPAATKEHPSDWLVTHKNDVLIGKVCSDCHRSKFCSDCHDTRAESGKSTSKEERVWDGSKPDRFPLAYTWNPISYDVSDGVGNESLTIILDNYSDRDIQEDALKYFTSLDAVPFEHREWGSYNAIKFMTERYFAAYLASPTGISKTDISTINSKQLHRVLIDDDTQRAVFAGSTLTLKEGYVLKVEDVDITSNRIILSLLKDGSGVVTAEAVEAGKTFVYKKRAGSIANLPIIAMQIKNVFRGREANVAYIKGMFQIAEGETFVNKGYRYGIMEITEVSDAGMALINKESFTLSQGSIVDVMGNIKLKIEDSHDVRFYPFVMTDRNDVIANLLAIDAPLTPMVKDMITIAVTSGGKAVIDAAVSFDNTEIGTTDSAGKLYYTLTVSGVHNITATKLGYVTSVRTIYVSG